MEDWDDAILSELSDSAFDLPPLEFEDDEDIEEGECSSNDGDNNEVNLVEAITPSVIKKNVQVLIDIDETLTRVVTLKDATDDLGKELFKLILRDPELNEYFGLAVTFKVYNEKFSTWVDHDTSKELVDGMHLKAVFEKIDTDSSKLRHREKSSRKRHHSESSDDYSCKLKKYRQKRSHTDRATRKCMEERYKSDRNRSSGPISNHDLNQDDFGTDVYSVYSIQDNSCGFETAPLNGYQGNPASYKFNRVFEHIREEDADDEQVEDDVHYPEDEEDYNYDDAADDTEENHNLVSQGEVYRMSLGLTNKNPISALYELCIRLKWRKPRFQLQRHCVIGAVNQFWMKVTVNGVTYTSKEAEKRKQLAKAAAAKHCLQRLGVFK